MSFRLSALLLAVVLPFAAVAESLPAEEDSVEARLTATSRTLDYAISLLGSPYKMGGKDPAKGTDCSGFVRHVYRETGEIELPHNALQMSQKGIAVDAASMEPGDLVFFNTRHKPFSHVGIYIGDGKFVHSASSHTRKVSVSRLGDHYWKARFNGARRVSLN